MCSNDFFDYSVISKKFTMRKKCLSGKPVLISTASWFNFGEGEVDGKVVAHPGEYWMKTSFSNQDPWQKVCILKGRSKLPPPTNIDLPNLYNRPHPMNPKKIADLRVLQISR